LHNLLIITVEKNGSGVHLMKSGSKKRRGPKEMNESRV